MTAPAPDEGLRAAVEALAERLTLFADRRMQLAINPPADDEYNRGIRRSVTELRAVLAAAGLDSTGGQGKSVVEWGVRFADGEDEFFMDGRGAATEYIALARGHIAAGDWEADDYEPMTLITRECTRYADTVTPWQPVEEADQA